MDLPPAFDADAYRAHNPDLSGLDDAAARAHWEREGRAAGRISAPLATREGLLAWLGDRPSVLEIGPFCRPLLTGPHVEYLDVLDAPALRQRARDHGLDPAGCPETIHHVGDLARVDRTFAAVISSHSVEHQPNLVRHLNEVERVLAPDGAYALLIPDKRYCFDHFLPESSIAQVVAAHHEGRTRHSLASVIEHRALTTHNDSGRHWAGDHGDPAQDRAARVADALRVHGEAEGGYVDVHAWQFTPDSFRGLVATLNALGLIGLEVAEVYDTPHGRNEFAAVLRHDAAAAARARARAEAIEVVVLQTADPVRYAPMLAVTQPNVIEYCRRMGFRYEAFVGLKRGHHAWQATYNRIPLLSGLLASGFGGWAFYLDADAWIADLAFDLPALLARHRDRAAIFATSGVTDRPWDVNAGVALVNLGHPLGRRLVERWQALFDGVSDARLKVAERWLDDDNDQDLLHQVLRADAELCDAVLVLPLEVMNSPHAAFVRQHLRAQSSHLPARIRSIAQQARAALEAGGGAVPPPPDPIAERWRWRLAHPPAHEPPLATAPVPPPRPDLARRAIDGWRGAADVRPHEAAFVAALDAGDADTVAAMLAALGQSAIGNGILGGAQQQARAADPLFAHRLALWTQDRLVSLAEAVGALEVELPEEGRWGENAAQDPATLWARIGAALGADLAPPATMGGQLGLEAAGVVLHQRMLDAVHAAWRVAQLGADLAVCELGGGAGLVAHAAAALGAARWQIAGDPIRRAVQAYVLGAAPEGVTLAGTPGPCDLLVSVDALPALPAAADQLRAGREQGAHRLLSIDQEARLPGQRTVADIMAEAGGWRLVSRHRHWLRAGYIETLWAVD